MSGIKSVGRISFDTTKILGTGSTSTVFLGKFSGREVAVKKIPKLQVKPCRTEIDLLLKLDLQKNIVRYFIDEEDVNFFYIALEKCDYTIKDYVVRADLEKIITKKKVILEIFSGFEWLHSKNIVHRDVKPSNILLLQKSPQELEVKISDLGLGKALDVENSQMSVTQDGSFYWTVPEMKMGKYNIKSDVYSLGCLVYYIQNNGRLTSKSPHSDLLTFDWITFDKSDSCDGICSRHLISIMTAASPSHRPSIACLLFHPLFWNNEKILEFFIGISNRLELRDSLSQRARSLFQENSQDVIGGNWLDHLDSEIRASLPHNNRTHYDGFSVENLIRALRNKKNHFDDMSHSAKQKFGAIPDGYTEYWTGKFPKLLLHIFLKFYKSGLSQEDNFAQFYPKNETCTENFE